MALKGLGGNVGRIATGVATGGISETGNLLGGRIGAYGADPFADEIREKTMTGLRTAEKGLKGFEGLVDQQAKISPQDLIQRGIGQELKGVQQQGQDLRRNLQERIARLGVGRTSIGLGQLSGIDKNVAEQANNILASQPERLAAELDRRAQLQERLTKLGAGLYSSTNVPIDFYGNQGQSKLGALLGIGGGVLGGVLGGQAGPGGIAGGASAGMGAGKGLGALFG